MARSVEDIKSEIAHLKGEGMHQATREMRDLRAELKAAEAEDQAPEAPEVDVKVEMAKPVEAPSDPFLSNEWAFVEKCCSEANLNHNGQRTEIPRKTYQEVVHKVETWRMLREVFQEVGPGGHFPTWGETGRNPNTGKIDPKYAPRPAKPKKPAVKEISVTEMGDPIRPAAPSKDAILGTAGLAADALAQVQSRPEPVRAAGA